ncbi:MAG TPA: glycosyltransferase family 9 protein [Desulfobacterales bacterium]|nr:glycosyltransferase family 9 protein [Desulfobacterales bacterium]
MTTMNLDLIRTVDKWIGIPACFFVSLASRIGDCLGDWRQDESRPCTRCTKMLFIELSEMGSAILAYPAMKYVLRRHPGAELYFLIFEQNRFSVDILDVIPAKNVLTIDMCSPVHFLFSTLKAVVAMRRIPLDAVFDLELFSRFSSLLSGLSRACKRVGYRKYHEEGLYRGSFMTHPVLYNPHQHMANNFLALVKAIEREGEYPRVKEVISKGDLVKPCYKSPEQDLMRLKARLAAINPTVDEAKHLVLLNPNAGDLLPVRAWSVENYAVLTERILKQFNAVVIVIGLKGAGREATSILGHVGTERCIDFTNKTSFKDLVDLLNLADVLVTTDGGPAHFAGLTSIKNVVLFGPETPALYAPLGENTTCLFAGLACSPCLSAYNHRKTSCTDSKCLKAITVDEVFEIVSLSLSGPAQS